MDPCLSDEQIAKLSSLISKGQKIEAIKFYREATGLGLKEAKEAIEQLERSSGPSQPEKLTVNPQSKGCLGVLVFGLLCFGLVSYWIG
jgi:Ribosomal protein L7/L12 C-terminal domain